MSTGKEGQGSDSRSGPATGSAHKSATSSAGMGSTQGQNRATSADTSDPRGFKVGGSSQIASGLPKGGAMPIVAMVGGALAVGAAYYFWNYGTTSHSSVPTGMQPTDRDGSKNSSSRDTGSTPERNAINTNISSGPGNYTKDNASSAGIGWQNASKK